MELIKEPSKLSDMLMLNPYEQLVPYNLWFEHPDYKVVHQTTRIRLWANLALTPVYGVYDVISKTVVKNMTVYQPFYPEQFYQIHQILEQRRLSTNSVLALCDENSLGCLEAVIIWHEMNLDAKGIFDSTCKPKHDYLSTYGVTYKKTQDRYDLVIIDFIGKQSSVNDFTIDYSKTLAAYKQAKSLSDTILIRVSLANDINIDGEYIRSSISHPWNPECYILVGSDSNAKIVKSEWLTNIKTTKQEPLTYDYLMPVTDLKVVNPSMFASYLLSTDQHTSNVSKTKLIRAKLDLNHVKRVMDTKPTGKRFVTWETLARDLSVSQRIKRILKNVPNCTNAWLKCWELLNQFELLGANESKIGKSTEKHICFHVCEAPGAFILACQYYTRRYRKSYEWFAQTLHTQVDGALEDYFGVIANNPDRWYFGDLTDVDTIKGYVDIKPTFMTADGGVSAEKHLLNDYETLMDRLLLGQVTCILACLQVNGSALLKCFLPMSNNQTVSLVNVLTRYFDKVWLTKPVTSHDCNSEVYLVLKGYKGIDENVLESMYECLKENTKFVCPISASFYSEYENAVTNLVQNQINALLTHYAVYYDETIAYTLYPIIKKRVNAWLHTNKL